MSQENVEVVRKLFEYGAQGRRGLWKPGIADDDPFVSLWHPECVLEELAEIPDAASYHRRPGVVRYFEQIPELWDELSYTPVEIRDAPRGVLAVTEPSVKAYTDRHAALEAVGLSE